MNQLIGDLFERIYTATAIPPNISDTNLITLIHPLVKAAYESKNETNPQHIDDVIQCEGEKFIKKLKDQRHENELEFFKFQRRFAIRSILQNYYECEQTDMTFRKLYNHLKPQCTSVNLTTELLKSWLNRLGFSVVTAPHNRDVVIEMHSQKLTRLKFIRRIQSLREAKRNIVYFREVTINLSTASTTNEDELTVFFAANHSGLLNFAFVEKDAKTKENFVEWLTIISGNQPKQTVLVIEPKAFSAPPRPTIFNTIALPSAFKYERIWNNYNTFIPGTSENAETIYSIEMLEFCWRIRDISVVLKKFIDPAKTMEDAGFEVVHLPCLHPELSPMHRIDFVKLINDIDEKRIDVIRKAIRTTLDNSTAQEWQRYFDDAIRLENDFLRFEALLGDDDDDAIEMDDSSSDVQIVDENGETVTLSDDVDDDDDDED